MRWLSWAEKRTEHTTDSDIEMRFEQNASAVKRFGAEFQQLLCGRTPGCVLKGVHSAVVGHELEAYRILENRFEPRTADTKRPVCNHMVSVRSASRVDEVEHSIRHLKDLLHRY